MEETKQIGSIPEVTNLAQGDMILSLNAAGAGQKISPDNLRSSMTGGTDTESLNNLGFYIDVNKASALGTTRVDVGGNLQMRAMWESAHKDILMDANGNYCELNPNDCRYTAEGEAVIDIATGAVLTKWAKCDFMRIIPKTYGRIQSVTINSTTVQRLWLSLVPLPGGYEIPQQVVGKFKAGNVSNVMRSLPAMVPDNTTSINAFWGLAQARSKNHGLAGLDFRNSLLFYMMSKYAYRDAQNCKATDGTLVWGVGLDGTESTGADKFVDQKSIKTGATLSLGKNDGKVEVLDNNGTTVHSVNVCGFENPYGQYWEMVQGLCSVGTNVYFWRGNVLPAGTPTAASFAGMNYVLLQRPKTYLYGMNIIPTTDGQGCYMIPKDSASGVSYGDNYIYSDTGQLWRFGGYSDDGAVCGLAAAVSSNVWSYAYAGVSARLAYYGGVTKVTPTRLAELAV